MPNEPKPSVFIASSSESSGIVNELRRLLGKNLGTAVQIKPWTRGFDLSATYIESLEKALRKADFGVFVLGPSDVTISRKQKSASPRDNVLFELGLFMGRLGRRRCFAIVEGDGLKVPSDLLGISMGHFNPSQQEPLEDLLNGFCLDVSDEITKQGRCPFTEDDAQYQAANKKFCRAIEGSWWERHDGRGASVSRPEVGVSLTFFRIEPDSLHNSVCFTNGKSFNAEGDLVASWKSMTARADDGESKVHYVWRGWLTGQPSVSFHGYGEMEFDRPADSTNSERGWGRFWDVEEAKPQRTNRKSFQLRRLLDEREGAVVFAGKEKQVKSLVKRITAEW